MSQRRNSGAGAFAAAIAAAAVLALGFIGFLYWRSHETDDAASPAPAASQPAPVRAAPPSPAPESPIVASAHPLEPDERLPLGGTSAVRYTSANGAVTFQFEVAGNEWPSIDADVNQNGRLDANLDRSYTIAGDGSFCAQYILGPESWSECGGAPSGGRATIEGSRRARTRTVTLSIPAGELSSDPNTAHIAFKLCRPAGGGWKCSQSPGGAGVAVDFSEMLAISLH